MKVLMIGNHPDVKGGITSVITQTLKYTWENDDIHMKFIPTYVEGCIVNRVLYFLAAYIKILVALLSFQPNVLHIHMSYRGSFYRKYLIHRLAKTFKVRDIIHIHGSEFRKWYNSLSIRARIRVRKLLRECETVIVLGDEWNKIIKDIEPKAHTIVVRNTVRIPEKQAHWNEDCFQILYLGVLIKRKGVDDLLQAMSEIKNHSNKENVKLVIAGTGEEEEYLKKRSVELGIDSCVEFVGWTTGTAKKRLLEESQLFVLPSYHEGLPISILEAISYGIPVVATCVGDNEAAVIDGNNGYIITPGDIKELAMRILELTTKAQFEKFSKRSRKLAQDSFSETEYFTKLRQIYAKGV